MSFQFAPVGDRAKTSSWWYLFYCVGEGRTGTEKAHKKTGPGLVYIESESIQFRMTSVVLVHIHIHVRTNKVSEVIDDDDVSAHAGCFAALSFRSSLC